MKIKEAIEFLSDIEFPKDTINSIRKINQIIKMLQHGERYEAILREIKYEIDWHRPEREVYDSGSKGDDEYINETLDLIDRVEQKYFPKE